MISVTGSLATALDSRKEAAASPASNLAWTTGKISWLKFTSNVLQNGKKSQFQSLGGDMASASNLYDKGSRSVPTPGVISATIKHTGTLKTLKKIEVSYKCWSVPHLEEMEKLFMSLGKTVVLEYGWSKKSDGTAVTSILTEAQMALGFGEFITATDKLAKTNKGSYGAEKGVVSNFSWTANDDGSYDCSTSFISPSEMMMSQDTQTPGKSATCCRTSEGNEVETDDNSKNCKKDSDITIKLKHLMNSEALKVGEASIKGGVTSTTTYPKWGFGMSMDKDQTEEEKKDKGTNWNPANWGIWGAIMTDQKFVTWAYFEESIMNDALMSKPELDNPDARNNFGTSKQQAPASYRNDSLKTTTRFDCRMTKIANPKGTTSSDPTICWLPDQNFWDLADTTATNYDRAINSRVNDFQYMEGLKLMSPFKVWNAIDPNDDNLGWLSHVCINVRFLISCAEESTSTEDLINKVLDGINSACGNPWEFVVTPLPSNPLITTIVDVKALGAMVDPYSLKLQGNQTIIRTATLDTNVSNDIKAQIMCGSNAPKPETGTDARPAGEFSLFGLGLTDRTGPWNNQTFELLEPCEDIAGEKTERADDNVTKEKANLIESWEDAWQDLTSAMTAESISTMKSTVKALQLFSPYEDIVQTQPPMLPLNLKFTMDGIHGFKWGHSLTVDPLPARYSECTFMVTGVDHNITKDTWDTSISTVLRIPPLPEPKRKLRTDSVKPMSSYQARDLGLSNKGAMG